MRGLSAQELLYTWEVALRAHSVEQAITILEMALPEVPRGELIALSVGQRDARLLSIREATFGTRLDGFAECPACQARLEFAFNVSDIRVLPENRISAKQAQEVAIEGFNLRYRLPDSSDLAQIVCFQDVMVARDLLLQRCVLQARQENVEVEVAALPESVIAILGRYMLESDPQAEVQIDLSCAVCSHNWLVNFDIVQFFWSEICAQAKRLMREVHMLARAYCWSEADILAMSAARRQFYLEMVT
jgi:hypothetical protein